MLHQSPIKQTEASRQKTRDWQRESAITSAVNARLKPRASMKQKSARQAKRDREYLAVIKQMDAGEPPKCKRCADNGVERNATEHHHLRGRIKYRDVDNLTNPETIISMCFECHEWAENNRAEAMRLGYRLSRHTSSQLQEEQKHANDI